MPYKWLALDMDGTLLDDRREISPVTRKALEAARQKGIRIVLATGRSIRTVRPYAEQLGFPVSVVANNGAQNWLDLQTPLKETPLNPERVRHMRELALGVVDALAGNAVRFWGHGLEASYYSDRGPHPFPPVESVRWLSFALEVRDPVQLGRITCEISGWPDVETSRAVPTQVEITARGVTKATGLRQLGALLGVVPAEMAAIGDGMNDLAMLRMAGLGAAMANAEEAVKAACSLIAPSNNNDGVAWLVRRLLDGTV